MRLNKSDFAGLGSVFRFTFTQFIKSKANIITTAILLLFALFSGPILTLLAGADVSDIDPDTYVVSKIYIQNETDLNIALPEYGSYGEIEFQAASPEDNVIDRLENNEILIRYYNAEDGSVSYEIYNNSYSFDRLAADVIRRTVCAEKGITEEQYAILSAQGEAIATDYESYKNPGEQQTEDDLVAAFAVQYAYSIIVLMICLYSTVFIIRAIIEEKESRLVELLMVSIKPLALILGKIFAVMCYIVALLLALLAAALCSLLITSSFSGVTVLALVAALGLTALPASIGGILIAVLVSLVLGYLTFSIIGGISGSCCSTMEDVQSANLGVTFLALFGYMVTMFAPIFNSEAFSIVLALLPVTSVFCAPALFITNSIPFIVLAASWLLQCVYILLLSRFCSKVYAMLIIHRGSRIRFKQLIGMAKEAGK